MSTTTATAAVLTIVDQKSWSSSHWRLTRLILSFGRKSASPRMADPYKHGRLRPAIRTACAASADVFGGGSEPAIFEAAPSLISVVMRFVEYSK